MVVQFIHKLDTQFYLIHIPSVALTGIGCDILQFSKSYNNQVEEKFRPSK